VVYPKASISYIVSDESFFPKYSWLNQLRLRGAYGASGVQPRATTALATYTATTVSVANSQTSATGTDSPGIRADSIGNPNLKPERSAEREMGFETRLFNRVNVDFTYYNNTTKDALISQPIAASAGAAALVVTRNLGSVRNTGLEATVTTTLFERPAFGWNLTIGGSHNTNKIESLGEQPCTVDPVTCPTGTKPNPTIGTGANRDSVGLPIRGIFARPYTFADKDNNGIIDPSEVTVDPNFIYIGSAVPRDLLTVQNSFDLFNRKLTVNVQLDYRGGFSIFNNSFSFLCQQKDTCYDETHAAVPLTNGSGAAITTQTASLEDQARLIALRYKTPSTSIGYWENGQFWRLREVGVTWTVPDMFAQQLRARDASLTFTARNLHVWTSYKGTDPESNFASSINPANSTNNGNVQTDLLTTAPPSYFTLRLNLHF
jgi:hypothetical protein